MMCGVGSIVSNVKCCQPNGDDCRNQNDSHFCFDLMSLPVAANHFVNCCENLQRINFSPLAVVIALMDTAVWKRNEMREIAFMLVLCIMMKIIAMATRFYVVRRRLLAAKLKASRERNYFPLPGLLLVFKLVCKVRKFNLAHLNCY